MDSEFRRDGESINLHLDIPQASQSSPHSPGPLRSSHSTFRSEFIPDPSVLKRRYEDYTTIDWVQDAARARERKKNDSDASFSGRESYEDRWMLPVFRNKFMRPICNLIAKAYDNARTWVVLTIIGVVIGTTSAFMGIVTEFLSDLRLGYCSKSWYLNLNFCCLETDTEFCEDWNRWSDFSPFRYLIFALFAALFSSTCAFLVKYFAKYAAGSGVSEIKVIISGFIIHGFLGVRTFIIKAVGLPLAIASGLSVGKEGPTVHVATCAGHIIARLFSSFRTNATKMREIYCASAATGVAVAFGSPIGGVIFSLEEMSSQFTLKTMWRSFFCALIATLTLASINPFRTGQLVMFQVHYNRSWHFFEIFFFIILGVFGGLYGAFVIKWNLRAQAFRKRYLTNYPIMEATFLASMTALVGYFNVFMRLDMTKSMEVLFRECDTSNNYHGLCKNTNTAWIIISLLLATILRTFFIIISYGCKVPAGIFIPSMAVGASFGRMVGELVRILQQQYPDSPLFSACQPDVPCITPGTYAFLGAAATLSGIMHITVSVVVIMFELTGALTFILPTMIVVGVSKALKDMIGIDGIADKMIHFSGFPFLDNKEEHSYGIPVSRVMSSSLVVIPSSGITFGELVAMMRRYSFGGFPIVEDRKSKILLGYIARYDLDSAIDHLRKVQRVANDTVCQFNTADNLKNRLQSHDESIGSEDELLQSSLSNEMGEQDMVDFMRFVDSTPLTLHSHSALETAIEIFQKIGPRVILVEQQGKLVGLLTVKDVLRYQFEVESESHPLDQDRMREQEEWLWKHLQQSFAMPNQLLALLSSKFIR